MRFDDRYSSAIHSSNLKSKPETECSDSDVLGAAGLAAKHAPLAMALLRLLSGDNHASREVVDIMAGMLDGKAYRMQVELTRVEAADMARAVLAWVRDGVCRPCGGIGAQKIENTNRLGTVCPTCRGTGKRPFEKEFPMVRVLLAQWMLAEVERELAKAGPAAMAALAPKLEL